MQLLMFWIKLAALLWFSVVLGQGGQRRVGEEVSDRLCFFDYFVQHQLLINLGCHNNLSILILSISIFTGSQYFVSHKKIKSILYLMFEQQCLLSGFIIQKLYPLFSFMSSLLPALQPLKDRLPLFILKLYHILEQDQYSQYIAWHGQEQLVIRQPKMVYDRVLKDFFKLQNFASFVRQLNIYNFRKVVKVIKSKHHMYFKNEHFQRGQIQQLLLIKRQNTKSKRTILTQINLSTQNMEESVSIAALIPPEQGFNQYKSQVNQLAGDLIDVLNKMLQSHPHMKGEVTDVLKKCSQLRKIKVESRNQQWNWERDPASMMPSPAPYLPSRYDL